jgi:hypothetical protein
MVEEVEEDGTESTAPSSTKQNPKMTMIMTEHTTRPRHLLTQNAKITSPTQQKKNKVSFFCI